ncbi:hypothetical protein EZS27_038029 [termite gut metagenome]|uniref:Antitoxin SocA-like Panacea domain-containing protein n=1 Tax=termite gut metagenome TaxID=433724 RepID=A0A5J4PQ88_9ZZZZ
MAVLKMIYFAQELSFPIFNERLIKDAFYAWQFGPVEKKTYEEFNYYGERTITRPSNKTKSELNKIRENTEIKDFLDKIYNGLIDIKPFVLSARTHEKGSPWSQTEPYEEIDIELIRKYHS